LKNGNFAFLSKITYKKPSGIFIVDRKGNVISRHLLGFDHFYKTETGNWIFSFTDKNLIQFYSGSDFLNYLEISHEKPGAICEDVTNGNIFIASVNGAYSNITIYSNNGKYLHKFPCQLNPCDIALDLEGNFVVVNLKSVGIFDKNGKFIRQIDVESAISVAIDLDGNIIVGSGSPTHYVQVFSSQ
jgi:hypothetical protein